MRTRSYYFFFLSFLTVMAIALTSCGPTTPQTGTTTTVTGTAKPTTSTSTTTTTTTSTTPSTTTATATASNVPKYGGVLTTIVDADMRAIDDSYTVGFTGSWSLALTNEELFEGDWARGPAGTNELDWMLSSFELAIRFNRNALCESWTLDPNDFSITFKIRRGIHFHNKAPTNGREMTAEDVAFSLARPWTIPGSFLLGAYPKPEVTVPEAWTVKAKWNTLAQLNSSFRELADIPYIWPKDALLANNNDMRDWRVSIGTGPFMWTDYVKGSSATLVRNPDYWDKDPVGPGKGNQLPYLDGVKILIVTDASTRLAAMRTAKGDQDYKLSWEEAASLKQTNPELMFKSVYYQMQLGIHMRQDKDFPWNDVRVRQAMIMAIDQEAIVNSYYGGEAVANAWPTPPSREFDLMRVPFDQLPANVREIYTYNPTKAKQLLTDAGYGTGFSIEVICRVDDVDLMSIIADYWSKIGVELIIQPKEFAAWQGTRMPRTHTQGIVSTMQSGPIFVMDQWRAPETNPFNGSFVKDAKTEEAYKQIWDAYPDLEKQAQIWKDITPYILERADYIPTPVPAQYTFWQPWVKGYHGEYGTGNSDGGSFPKYVWIDQDLKEQMIGVR